MNRYLSVLDMLLDYAEDESTVGEIGGMINHSEEYNEYRDIVEKVLLSVEKFEELVNMDLDLFMKAVDIKGLIEDYQKIKKVIETLRNKKVNLEYLKCCENYEQYKTICSYWNEITEQEFNSLKEVLV